MFDRQLAAEVLRQVLVSAETVINRFASVKNVSDFVDTPSGMEKLDSICMQLIVIGEGLKNFDKVTNNTILYNYPEIDWKKVKGLRDIITHHYSDVNAEAIFDACKNKLPALKLALEKVLADPNIK